MLIINKKSAQIRYSNSKIHAFVFHYFTKITHHSSFKHCATRNYSTFHILHSKFHEVCFDEIIDFAVHDAIDVRCLVVGAVVFDAAVVEDV